MPIRHVLPESERRCSCGCELAVIGEEESEQLDVIPARIQVLHHIRERYACPRCEAPPVLAPLPSQPIPKGNASAGLLAHIAVAKYQDGLPLHRQEAILARSGIELPRQTLARWMIRAAELAQPLLNLLWDELLSNPVIHCDETTVQVLKEAGKPPTSLSYMWALAAGPPERPVVLFDYRPSRSGEIPKRLLTGYKGYLMTDGYEAITASRPRTASSTSVAWCTRAGAFAMLSGLSRAVPPAGPTSPSITSASSIRSSAKLLMPIPRVAIACARARAVRC